MTNNIVRKSETEQGSEKEKKKKENKHLVQAQQKMIEQQNNFKRLELRF